MRCATSVVPRTFMPISILADPKPFVNTAHHRRVAVLALIAVNAMWGLSFPIMKSLNIQMDQHFGVTEATIPGSLRISSAAWMIAIRFAAAFAMFAIVFPRSLRGVQRTEWLGGAAIGAFFCSGLILQVIGLATIEASRSGFLTSLSVVFTPLLSTLVLLRRPRFPSVLGAVVAVIGVSILTGVLEVTGQGVSVADAARSAWTIGDSLTALSAIFFSGQILLLDHLGTRCNSIALTPGMFLSTATIGGIMFVVFQKSIPSELTASWLSLTIQPQFFVLIAVLGAVASTVAFSWMNKYQPAVSATQAAVIYTLEPVFVSVWAMFLPGWISVCCGVEYANENIGLPTILGGTLVLLANVLALWSERKVTVAGRTSDITFVV